MSLNEYTIITIDGRQYRKRVEVQQSTLNQSQGLLDSSDLNNSTMYEDEPQCEQPLTTEQQVNSLFSTAEVTARTTDTTIKISIPQIYHKQIIGRSGTDISKIKEENKCKIAFAANEDYPDEVRIEGIEEQKVIGAMERLKTLFFSRIQQLHYTHFLCIPFKSADLLNQIEQFQATLSKVDGIPRNYLTRAQSLHLTLSVMKIILPEQVDVASVILGNTSSFIYSLLNNHPLMFEFCGIDCMGDPRATSVLYVKVKPTKDVFEKIVELLKNALGYYIDDKTMKQKLLLHLTIFNTNKIKSVGKKAVIDATDIIKKYSGKSFGKYPAETIDLCQMNNKQLNLSYSHITSIPLP
ncbi:Activating signal cointegrator 1 complex subunit [Entamoeba marina]